VNVLVVAAHPDDEILGVGGTLRKHAMDGAAVEALIMCEGAGVRYPEDHNAVVEAQTDRAAGILGISQVHRARLPDQRLETLPLTEVASAVETVMGSLVPDIVYTHFGGDVNYDHHIVFRAVQVATRPYAAPSVAELLVFETPSSTEWGAGFEPDVFVDISETLDEKLEAFACYESEIRPAPHPRSPEALRALAEARGSVIGAQAAEAFRLIRSIR
jgi:LmbE family N-acetylglucosaminyl deacetylase